MIARLSGRVAEKGAAHAVVDVGGVGYLVQLSQLSLSRLPPPGGEVQLRIQTHVREDAFQLFGFATEEEETVFAALVGVNGVGPKSAMQILSGIEPRDLARAIADGNVARLTKVQGVGKKTAERLVVELRDKLVALARAAAPAGPAPQGALEQLAQALTGLGFKAPQAEQAAEALREKADRPLDELLREALKLLRGQAP